MKWIDRDEDGPVYPSTGQGDVWVFWMGVSIGGAVGLLVGALLGWVFA